MNDADKTKEQLIEELNQAREKLSKVEQITQRFTNLDYASTIDLLHALVNQAPLSIWICDADANIVVWGDGAAQIYEEPPEKALGARFIDLFVEDVEKLEAEIDLQRTINDGTPFLGYTVKDKTGVMVTYCYRIQDQKGVPYQVEIAAEATDTELVREQIQLGKRLNLLERFRGLSEKLGRAVHTDEDMRVMLLHIAEALSTVIDDTPLTATICLLDDKHENMKASWSSKGRKVEPSLNSLVPFRNLDEALFVDQDNNCPIEFQDNASKLKGTTSNFGVIPIRISDDQLLGLLYVHLTESDTFSDELKEALGVYVGQVSITLENALLVQDLRSAVSDIQIKNSELNNLNKKIADREQEATRSQVARDFAHKVNNISGIVPIRIQMIKRSLTKLQNRGNNTEDSDDISRIGDNLSKIENQIEELHEGVRKINQEQSASNIDLNDQIERILQNIQEQFPHITIERNFTDNLPSIKAIEINVSHALDNILSNAVEAITGKGRIQVTTRLLLAEESKEIELEFKDNGKGIPSDIIENIFELNYSTKGTTRGYGLWRTKDVIERLGGSITVESQPGIETTFTVHIPVQDPLTQESK